MDPERKDDVGNKNEEEGRMDVEEDPHPKDADYIEDGTRWKDPDKPGPSRL